jgi:hypothetical protein
MTLLSCRFLAAGGLYRDGGYETTVDTLTLQEWLLKSLVSDIAVCVVLVATYLFAVYCLFRLDK